MPEMIDAEPPSTLEPPYNEAMATTATTLTPYLAVHDAEAAIDFYKRAFGAEEVGERYPWEGKIGHAELRVAGAPVSLADEFAEYNVSPRTLGGSPVALNLHVEDVDRWTERALAAGAELVSPPTDNDYGRVSKITDPFGHVWMFHGPNKSA
jgi:PhnB protein